MDLEVESASLQMTADHLDMHRAEHIATHAATNAGIETASAGWVGGSALVLQAKMTDWVAQSLYMENELTHFRDAFDQCGTAYASTDEQAKANIMRTRLSTEST